MFANHPWYGSSFCVFWPKYKIPGTSEDYENKMELLRNIKSNLPSFSTVNIFNNSKRKKYIFSGSFSHSFLDLLPCKSLYGIE